MEWNNAQLQAIEGKGGTILVSAAAGSGKTAVLVERILRKLCDESKPVSIEDFLVVTFTKAAAAQMKEKISKALAEKVAENPNNTELRRNLFMLPYANICTIDSFCINLVRDNFHKLNISPDFQILDAGAEKILEEKAMNEIITRFHKDKKDEFRKLNSLINKNEGDNEITGIINKLHTTSEAYVFPQKWLEEIYDTFTDSAPLAESKIGKKIIEDLKCSMDAVKCSIDNFLSWLLEERKQGGIIEEITQKYIDVYNDDMSYINKLYYAIESNDWDTICEVLASAKLHNNNIAKKQEGNYIKEKSAAIRTYNTKENSFIAKFPAFYISEEEHKEAVKDIAPSLKLLTEIVIDYGKELMSLKAEENSYSFSDILHFTLDLLVEEKDGEAVKTQFAKEISNNYEEILVDEYQDVNKAQDTVFWALSKDDTNRFLVGDVKQCIYCFRQAMPDIFTSLRKKMCDYDGVNYPARIILNKNYRSRKGVTDTANFIFSQIMSEEAGGVDYNENEYLNAAAQYPEKDKKDSDFEVYLLETESDGLKAQAQFVAKYIKDAVNNKIQISDKNGTHDACYGDFCILARSAKKCANIFAEVFDEIGIPLIADTENPLLSSPEVTFISSLLRVIDNPLNDIPLVSVLLSPIYGFTTDELAEMRVDNRSGSIYECLVKNSKTSEKSAHFLAEIEKLRLIAVTQPAGEFVSKIIDETGYRAIVSAMINGEMRVANINAFINLAKTYEKSGVKGISGFIRFIDKLEDSSENLSGASRNISSNSVSIMTIHKSKGLEFPYVFLVNCEKIHNDTDLKKSYIISRKMGIGLKWIKNNTSYPTISFELAKKECKEETYSEELRVLYVALTRAKEKTVVVSSNKDWAKALSEMKKDLSDGSRISSDKIMSMKNYSKYILTALLKHPDAHLLRDMAGLDSSVHLPCDTSAKFELISDFTLEEEAKEEETITYNSDSALISQIDKNLSYVYPYNSLNKILSKRIASDLEDEGFNDTYFASEIPAFKNEGKLTPAQKGTATHRFMQYADYKKASENPEKEKQKLVNDGMLTELEAEAVDSTKIKKFFESNLAKRILNADKVYKEYSFTVSMPVKEIYPDIDEKIAKEDVVIIEGVVDCAFEENGKLVIVDYKTDRANHAGDLKERYSKQLSIYEKSLSKALNIEISEKIIYSFALSEEIKL